MSIFSVSGNFALDMLHNGYSYKLEKSCEAKGI